jgi:hypothetical protein
VLHVHRGRLVGSIEGTDGAAQAEAEPDGGHGGDRERDELRGGAHDTSS